MTKVIKNTHIQPFRDICLGTFKLEDSLNWKLLYIYIDMECKISYNINHCVSITTHIFIVHFK